MRLHGWKKKSDLRVYDCVVIKRKVERKKIYILYSLKELKKDLGGIYIKVWGYNGKWGKYKRKRRWWLIAALLLPSSFLLLLLFHFLSLLAWMGL